MSSRFLLGNTVAEKHGLRNRAEYGIWASMKQRCLNPKNTRFAEYGGRGIDVCDRWRLSAEAFFEDMGPRPSPLHTLDRIDNDKGYSPENCRWATPSDQQRNTRRKQTMVTLKGVTKPLRAWAAEIGIAPNTLMQRVEAGWPEASIMAPSKHRGYRPRSDRALRRS